MRVIISDVAVTELEEIGNFIAQDNADRADSFVLELLEHCEKLARHPLRYPLMPGLEHLGLRRCPYRAYVILYLTEGSDLEVAHIFHGARDYGRILFPED